jgi:hypothetical protein
VIVAILAHIAPQWGIFQWFHQLFWPETGQGYAFTSSLGSTFFIGSFFALAYRKLNCHQDRCWRIGKHKVDGTPYITCKKHHPAIPAKITADHIATAHSHHLASLSHHDDP